DTPCIPKIDDHQDDRSCPENSASDRADAFSAIRDKPDRFAAPFPIRARLILCRACPDLHPCPAIRFQVCVFPRAQTHAEHSPVARFPNAATDRETIGSPSAVSDLQSAAEFESEFAARRSRYRDRKSTRL